ncbi:hypothetical protein JD844_008463, partial [Phrynosoma platyrhinos]
ECHKPQTRKAFKSTEYVNVDVKDFSLCSLFHLLFALQDARTNVKSIMAKFNSNPAEEVHNRQVKIGGQPSLVTKAAFEKFTQLENAGLPVKPSSFNKPAPLKPPLGTKPSLHNTSDKDPKPPPLKNSPVASKVAALAQAVSKDAIERPGFPKPLGPKPTERLKLEPKPLFPKPSENRLPGSSTPLKNETKPLGLRPSLKPESQESEAKPVFPKVKEKISASQENELKPLFSKPPLREKPGLHPGLKNEEEFDKNVNLIRAPSGSGGLKPKVNSFRTPKEAEEKSNSGMDSTTGPFPPLKHVVNTQSNLSPVLQKSLAQQNEEGSSSVTKNISRFNQEDSGSMSGATSAKFSLKAVTTGPWANNSEKEENDKNVPKRKTLPPLFKLGPPPQKPSRPPTVDLEKFQKNNGESSNKFLSSGLPPPLPPSISATQTTAPQPPAPIPPPPPPPPPGSHPSAQAPPVLPPRNIKPRPQENEENYDDAEFVSGGTVNADEFQNSEGETYEDINDMRKKNLASLPCLKLLDIPNLSRDSVHRLIGLVSPIEVIHQARACTDFKGGKNDLSFKQGDKIEIIRITDNPEGKWLGRTRGACRYPMFCVLDGYIKTTMVEIDYDSLRRKPRPSINIQPRQQDSDQEVYDDVGDQDSISSFFLSRFQVGFPPPPSHDIYDGVEDEDDVPTRGPSAKQTEKDSGDSDVYDDVEPTDLPPPPKEISSGINMKLSNFGKPRSDERDSQKIKKMEKEEKEFRKKFKFEGDIHVLYSTTISRAPSQKKRGSKDLQVRPGESVDVIKNVDDTRVLCRNEDGKYGYVRRSCIVNEDDEIYDDIADGCIYDND